MLYPDPRNLSAIKMKIMIMMDNENNDDQYKYDQHINKNSQQINAYNQ